MTSAKTDICMPFIVFSSVSITLASPSNTMSNKKGHSGHFYLVPDLRWEAFTYFP